MLSVVQLSDLHTAPDGFRGFGGFGPDTSDTWKALTDAGFAERPDLVVVTGDITQNGDLTEFHTAGDRLRSLELPVTALTGNHDYQLPAEVTVPSISVSMNRSELHGNWLFIYIDTNTVDTNTVDNNTVKSAGESRARSAGAASDIGGVAEYGDLVSGLVDHPNRVGGNGMISDAELARVERSIDLSDADHVWLWMHHTPGAGGAFANEPFTGQVAGLLKRHDRIRGIGSGHIHNNERPNLADRPVYVCPSMTLNFDVNTWRTLPPGYRTYSFADDGAVATDVVWLDDPRWPDRTIPEPVVAHLQGEITWEEMSARLSAAPN